MKIALDYDGTFTEDVDLWWNFILNAKERGHTICVVTSRNKDHNPIEHELPCHVIYCSYEAKSKFFKADVWIDNDPKYIYKDIG